MSGREKRISHKEKFWDDERRGKWHSEEGHFKWKAAYAKGRILLGGQVQMKNVDLKWGTEKHDGIWKQQDLA